MPVTEINVDELTTALAEAFGIEGAPADAVRETAQKVATAIATHVQPALDELQANVDAHSTHLDELDEAIAGLAPEEPEEP